MMIVFAAETAPTLPSPEAVINAAIAAKAAELAANQSFYIGILIIVALLVIGAMMMFIAYKFTDLERNTNGMRKELVETTRKLALLEGNMAGREEQTQEQHAKKEKTK